MPNGAPKLIAMTTGHRTRAEKEFRKEMETFLYTGETFTESKQVRENKIAHKEFLRLKRLYSKIVFIDGLDEQIINRYCLEVANQVQLQMLLDKMEARIDECEPDNLVQLYKSISGVLSNINKSKGLLLKYEDRLFLNPAGRIKAIPKTPPKEGPKSGMAAFLAKRADG